MADVGVEEAGATRASEEDLPGGSNTASPEGRANSTGEHRKRVVEGSSRGNKEERSGGQGRVKEASLCLRLGTSGKCEVSWRTRSVWAKL